MTKAKFCLAPVLVVSISILGCGSQPVSQATDVLDPDQAIRAGTTIESVIQGRSFRLTPLTAQIQGVDMHSLEIIGDGINVAFAAQAPPPTPTVTGNEIKFGGHTFEVTATPNSYVVDGKSVQLPPGRIYRFNEGKFLGEFSLRP